MPVDRELVERELVERLPIGERGERAAARPPLAAAEREGARLAPVERELVERLAVDLRAVVERVPVERLPATRWTRLDRATQAQFYSTTINQRDVCSVLRAFDRRGFYDDVRQRMEVDDVADERERAAGQPSAARFLARMARIEQRDQRSGARETHRSHGARRSRADNGDFHSSSELSALSYQSDS